MGKKYVRPELRLHVGQRSCHTTVCIFQSLVGPHPTPPSSTPARGFCPFVTPLPVEVLEHVPAGATKPPAPGVHDECQESDINKQCMMRSVKSGWVLCSVGFTTGGVFVKDAREVLFSS